MPIVWAEFGTREETEQAIGRVAFAGLAHGGIDRVQAADGRWRLGIDADAQDAARVRSIMCDRHAPTETDLMASLALFGAAALAGLAISRLLSGTLSR
ncbi:MAG TPA: hypothetical protein VHG30_09890 [Microvirga sp.]|jgi:hypothetical protein|nr:hypothetical protein [Microvirga sp.]